MIVYLIFAIIIVLCILALWKPATCLGSAICIFSFEQWAQVHTSYFSQHSSYLNYAQGIIVLLGVIAVAGRTWNPLSPFPAVGYYVVGLFTLAFFSILWSISPQLSLAHFIDAFPYAAAFIFLLPLTITTTDDVRTAIVSSLVMGTICLLLLQYGTELHRWGRSIALREGVVTRSGEVRNRATPLAPATLAGHVIVMLCLMNFRRFDRIWYVLMWGVLPLAFYICLRSGTRGQYFAAVMVILALFGPARGIKRVGSLVAGGFVAAAVVLFAWYFLVEFGGSGRWGLSNMVRNYAETRLLSSQIIIRYWLTSSPPRLLLGLGSSASYDPSVLNNNFPHVLPVEIMCQLGLVGLAIYIAIVATTLASALRTFRIVSNSPVERGMLITLVGLFLFEFLRSLKEWPMLYHMYLFSVAILIGRFELLVRREFAAKLRNRYAAATSTQRALSGASPPSSYVPGSI